MSNKNELDILRGIAILPTRTSLCAESTDWGEWLSGLYSLRQVAEVKLGRVRSDFGWVTTEAGPRNSPRRPSEGTLN